MMPMNNAESYLSDEDREELEGFHAFDTNKSITPTFPACISPVPPAPHNMSGASLRPYYRNSRSPRRKQTSVSPQPMHYKEYLDTFPAIMPRSASMSNSRQKEHEYSTDPSLKQSRSHLGLPSATLSSSKSYVDLERPLPSRHRTRVGKNAPKLPVKARKEKHFTDEQEIGRSITKHKISIDSSNQYQLPLTDKLSRTCFSNQQKSEYLPKDTQNRQEDAPRKPISLSEVLSRYMDAFPSNTVDQQATPRPSAAKLTRHAQRSLPHGFQRANLQPNSRNQHARLSLQDRRTSHNINKNAYPSTVEDVLATLKPTTLNEYAHRQQQFPHEAYLEASADYSSKNYRRSNNCHHDGAIISKSTLSQGMSRHKETFLNDLDVELRMEDTPPRLTASALRRLEIMTQHTGRAPNINTFFMNRELELENSSTTDSNASPAVGSDYKEPLRARSTNFEELDLPCIVPIRNHH